MSILDTPIIARIRRNHGLEHATITILSGRNPRLRLAGYSIPGGFFVLGSVPTEDLREAVVQALARLEGGERHLAVHPGCGTNYATSGIIAGGLAWLGMRGAKSKREQWERLPLALLLATAGLIISQPLGPLLQQRVTTSGDPAGMSIVDISPMHMGRLTLHRVTTRS